MKSESRFSFGIEESRISSYREFRDPRIGFDFVEELILRVRESTVAIGVEVDSFFNSFILCHSFSLSRDPEIDFDFVEEWILHAWGPINRN